jgi:hypothetical protein
MRYASVSITKGWKRYTCSAYVLMWCMRSFDPTDHQARGRIVTWRRCVAGAGS